MSWRIFICSLAIFLILVLAEMSIADTNSLGPNSINAAGLGLTGSGVTIGQVELERPGKPNFDILHNDLVDPEFVYYRDQLPPNDNSIKDKGDGLHPLQVAGVMIAEHSSEEGKEEVHGVAPGAILHAAAFDPPGLNYSSLATPLVTTNRIARQRYARDQYECQPRNFFRW